MLNILDQLDNNNFITHSIEIDYNRKNQIQYLIIKPIVKKDIVKPFVDFDDLTEEFMNVMEGFNKKIIKDDKISKSNLQGKENINKLFEIYKSDIDLVDTNTKRTLLFMLKEFGFDELSARYKEKKLSKKDTGIVEQVILEGIARMTDTYVEKLIKYYQGFSHFKYNKERKFNSLTNKLDCKN